MFIALVVVTILLAAMCAMSAGMKVTRNPRVITAIHETVGVPLRYLPVLAALELAGAAGILLGLVLEPLGIAAAFGLIAYFVGAVVSHLRVHDTKGITAPLPTLVLSVAVLVLRIATL